MQDDTQALRARLNEETGKLSWQELERHFARGVVVRVAPELDLVEVAACMASDDAAAVQAWMAAGQVANASTEEAAGWQARSATFWAVVVAPWVLVQETPAAS